jgi:hypothetical protein
VGRVSGEEDPPALEGRSGGGHRAPALDAFDLDRQAGLTAERGAHQFDTPPLGDALSHMGVPGTVRLQG